MHCGPRQRLPQTTQLGARIIAHLRRDKIANRVAQNYGRRRGRGRGCRARRGEPEACDERPHIARVRVLRACAQEPGRIGTRGAWREVCSAGACVRVTKSTMVESLLARILLFALAPSSIAALVVFSFPYPTAQTPVQILADNAGDIFLLSQVSASPGVYSSLLSKFNSAGGVVFQVSLPNLPYGMALSPTSDIVWVSCCAVVQINATSGNVLMSTACSSSVSVYHVTLDQQGFVWTASATYSSYSYASSLNRLSPTNGSTLLSFAVSSGDSTPFSNVMVDAQNNLVVSGAGILKYNHTGYQLAGIYDYVLTNRYSLLSAIIGFMSVDAAGNIYSTVQTETCQALDQQKYPGGKTCSNAAIKFDTSLNVVFIDTSVTPNVVLANDDANDIFLSLDVLVTDSELNQWINPVGNVVRVGATNESAVQSYSVDTACFTLDSLAYSSDRMVRVGSAWWFAGDQTLCKIELDASWSPSVSPASATPSRAPSRSPVRKPSRAPTTQKPSHSPVSQKPSRSPSRAPASQHPSASPTSVKPSLSPAFSKPSQSPSRLPSHAPTSAQPSMSPTSMSPTRSPVRPSAQLRPSTFPSFLPTRAPGSQPTAASSAFGATVGGAVGAAVVLSVVLVAAILRRNRRLALERADELIERNVIVRL